MRMPGARPGPAALGRRLGAVIAVAALAGCGSAASTPGVAPSSSTTVRSETPVSTPPVPSPPPSTPTAATTPGTAPMLWPFTTAAAAAAWRAGHTAAAADDWHLDAGQTALRFVREYLGYSELDRVTTTSAQPTTALVGVGSLAEGTTVATAGVLRLARATDQDPWEVTGTQDSDLTVTAPAAGQSVGTPLTVTGTITGVDESIAVDLRSPAVTAVLGQVNGIGAGGTRQPWTASVPYAAAPGTVITVAVSTGGHLQRVERFAVTGAVAG